MKSEMAGPCIPQDVIGLLERSKAYPQHTNRISSMGGPCERLLTYNRTHWQEGGGIDTGLKGIFQTGNELEPVIERIIGNAGRNAAPRWRIVGGQMPIVDKFFASHQLTGTIDGKIQIEFDQASWIDYGAADIKTCSQWTFDRFTYPSDLRRDKDHFGYKWYVQLTLYAFGLNLDRCVLLMVNKNNLFVVKAIEWNIDYDLVEEMVQRADRINFAVEAWRENGDDSMHPPKLDRPKVCRNCKFAHVCNPTLEYEGNAIFEDDEAEALLDAKFALENDAKQHHSVCSQLKDVLPLAPVLIVGDYVVKAKQRKDGVWVRKYSRKEFDDGPGPDQETD